MPSLEMRLLPSRALNLLLIIASVVSVGCASAGRTWSASHSQPSTSLAAWSFPDTGKRSKAFDRARRSSSP